MREVDIIGVPMDLGADRRGVDMGPNAIRCADLQARLEALGYTVRDRGNLVVGAPEAHSVVDPHAKYVQEIARACGELADAVAAARRAGRLPVVLGGDHSIAVGSIAGMHAAIQDDVKAVAPGCGGTAVPPTRRASAGTGADATTGTGAAQASSGAPYARRLGVLWFDAHGDCNTPKTSPSGNVHGMPLAASFGTGPQELVDCSHDGSKLRPEDVALIGVRELDSAEREWVRKTGMNVFTMHEVDRMGMARVVEEALARVGHDTDGLHVSFDMDLLDPRSAPGVGTPVPGGITYREAHLALECVAESGLLSSLEVVEVNPILDHANQTAEAAVALIASALGARIL